MKHFDELYREIEEKALNNGERSLATDFREGNITERPLVLYGAGKNCGFAISLCNTFSIPITCVCDSKLTGVYEYSNQIYEIITPDQLLAQYENAVVLITTWNYEQEISDFLHTAGFPDTQIYFLRNRNMILPEYFRETYLEGYRWAYDCFMDERSRQRILDRIRMYFLGRPCPADSFYQDGYFAFPDITLKDNEVYLDGGAFTGDTVEEFILYCEKKGKDYSRIYAFEPDPDNYEQARQTLLQYRKAEVMPFGLWSSRTELSFSNTSNITSHLTQENGANMITVPVTSLDTFFADKPRDEWPTIIKMDIEGAEKEALLGATTIIKEKKPQLIICVYHKPEDIYELPQTILNIRDDYQLILWQMGESFWDMVLYAV